MAYPSHDYVIRTAAPHDVDRIAELWAMLVAHHRDLAVEFPAAAANGRLRYARRVLNHLDDPTARVFVADSDGVVIGYVLGVVVDLAPEMFEHEASGFLADIFVDPQSRRRGVGRALVAALASWFAQQGLTYYEWHAAARNLEGVAFWRALGGREVMLRMRAEVRGEATKSEAT